jgi:CheY-like chemotaxis protein
MIRIKSGKMLVVAPTTSSILIPANQQVIHLANAGQIFPVIHATQPSVILLDHDYLGTDTEKVLRRLSANPFYSKIKIYCYKAKPQTKVDSYLQVLGVQRFVYAEDQQQGPKQKNATVKALSELLEARTIPTFAEAGF